MKIAVIVQARVESTRLPGKVLADIAGKPALAHVLERARSIDGTHALLLAIPDDAANDPLETIGAQAGARVVRGDRDDVLNRYHVAIALCDCDAVVRITADCPLLDPVVSSRVLRAFIESHADYASNTQPPTYPDGYDTEVASTAAIESAWREAVDPYEREHVMPFIWRRPERFRLVNVSAPVDRSSWRLTLDTADDLRRLREIYARLSGRGLFGLDEVAAIVAGIPELAGLPA